MTFKGEPAVVVTHHSLNLLLFVLGMGIVWLTTEGFVPLLGAFIASIHVAFKIKAEEPDKGAHTPQGALASKLLGCPCFRRAWTTWRDRSIKRAH